MVVKHVRLNICLVVRTQIAAELLKWGRVKFYDVTYTPHSTLKVVCCCNHKELVSAAQRLSADTAANHWDDKQTSFILLVVHTSCSRCKSHTRSCLVNYRKLIK